MNTLKSVTQSVEGQLQKYGSLLPFNKKEKALLKATKEGNAALAAKLLQEQAAVNFQDKEGSSPLHYASLKGHSGIALLLLQKGAF